MDNEKEIRQLKLEKYKATYEHNMKLLTMIYVTFLPLIVTIFFTLRVEISNIFIAPLKLLVYSLENGLKLSGDASNTIVLMVFMTFIFLIYTKGLRMIPKVLKDHENETIGQYTAQIDQLISECVPAEKKHKNSMRIVKPEYLKKVTKIISKGKFHSYNTVQDLRKDIESN